MIVLGLDFETTFSDPVNPAECRIIEIGAVLWSTKRQAPIELFNTLVYDQGSYPLFDPRITKLTGITEEDLVRYGTSPNKALTTLGCIMENAEMVVAHNGNEFDRPVYVAECERHGVEVFDLPWIDTRRDVPYREDVQTRKLTYLAAEHGFANPFAHRALFDVLTMLKVMSLYDFDEILELSRQPDLKLQACVTYHDRQLAKDRGYHWEGENKRWVKVMKLSQVEQEIQEAPFVVQMLENLSPA